MKYEGTCNGKTNPKGFYPDIGEGLSDYKKKIFPL